MAKVKLLSTGVTIVRGLQGAGKSLWAVKYLVEDGLMQRRPVYTNLPLRYRVVRRYLQVKGCGHLFGYLHPLTRDHVVRFSERFRQLVEFRAIYREPHSESVIERMFIEKFGDHIYKGPKANWIDLSAIIVIDEAHDWFAQGDEKKTPAIKQLVAMHRHAQYEIVLLSQHEMNIGLDFRRLTQTYIECENMAKRVFLPVLGLRFPLTVFHQHRYAGEDYKDGKRDPQARPEWSGSVVVPPYWWVRLTGGGAHGPVWWRLYESHTHMGSLRGMRRKLEAVRARIESGAVRKFEPVERKQQMTRSQAVLVAAAIFVGCMVVYYGTVLPLERQVDELKRQRAGEVAALDELRQQIAAEPESQSGPGVPGVPGARSLAKLEAVSDGRVKVDGQILERGMPGGDGMIFLEASGERGDALFMDPATGDAIYRRAGYGDRRVARDVVERLRPVVAEEQPAAETSERERWFNERQALYQRNRAARLDRKAAQAAAAEGATEQVGAEGDQGDTRADARQAQP